MLKKAGMNVVWCVAFLLAVGVVTCPPLAGVGGGFLPQADAQGIDSYTKLMLHMENNVTDSATGKTVTNNNVTFSNSAYKMGGYSGVFNRRYQFTAEGAEDAEG